MAYPSFVLSQCYTCLVPTMLHPKCRVQTKMKVFTSISACCQHSKWLSFVQALLSNCISLCMLLQVKTWTPNGDLLSASGHHHAAIQCLAVVPLTSPPLTSRGVVRGSSANGLRNTTTSNRRLAAAAANNRMSSSGGSIAYKAWAGAADGTLSVCVDSNGSGVFDPSGWKVFRPEGMKSARCMLLLPDNRIWVGTDDGRVYVFDGTTEAQLSVFKAAPSAINSFAAVGCSAGSAPAANTPRFNSASVVGNTTGVQQVWAASEKTVTVHDPVTRALLFSLPADPDGFVKTLLPWGWGLWVLSSNSLKQLAVRSAWDDLQQQVRLLSPCQHLVSMCPELDCRLPADLAKTWIPIGPGFLIFTALHLLLLVVVCKYACTSADCLTIFAAGCQTRPRDT